MPEQVDEDLNSAVWQEFAAKLLKQRLETPKTSIASPSFIARMTSSMADPDGTTSGDRTEPDKD